MSKPAALLPCPFCGSYLDSEDPAVFRETDGPKWGAVVCCITGPEVRTGYGPLEDWRDEAIAEWNKRSPPARANAEWRAADLTDAELVAELERCAQKFAGRDEGGGGSPGEQWAERAMEIETEQRRRAGAA